MSALSQILFRLPALCLLLGVALPCAAFDYVVLSSTSGGSILAQPLALTNGTVTLQRDDGMRFEVPLSQFTADSQDQIRAYVDALKQALEQKRLAQAQTPAPAPVPVPSPRAAQVRVAADQNDPSRFAVQEFTDPESDLRANRLFSEMDMTRIEVARRGDRTIAFSITFAEEIPENPSFENPYRVWLKLDLDDDATTGQTERGGAGEEVSVAVHGWRAGDSWKHYVVNKSDLGKAARIKVDNIRYADRTVHFDLHSPHFGEAEAFAFGLSACANGGTVVDTFPGGRKRERYILRPADAGE